MLVDTRLYIKDSLALTDYSSLLSGPFDVGDNTRYYIGRTKDSLKGDLYEIILFKKALTEREKYSVDRYLNSKYGFECSTPPVNLGQNIIVYSFCDTVLRAGTLYKSYLWSTGDTTSNIKVSKPGIISVTVKDKKGNASCDSI
jgi:hypothetical protein